MSGCAGSKAWLVVLYFIPRVSLENSESLTDGLSGLTQVERQLRISMQEECLRLGQPITSLGDHEVPLVLPEDEVARELQEALLEEGGDEFVDEEDEGKQRQLAITVRVRRKGKTGTAKGVS